MLPIHPTPTSRRPSRRSRPLALLAALAATSAPLTVHALTCAAPPMVVLVYPRGKQVAVDAQVFLHTQSPRLVKAISLIDVKTGKKVRLRRVYSKGSGMLRLVPRGPLVGERGYEVRLRRRPLGRFQTSKARLAGRGAPRLRSAKVSFGSDKKGVFLRHGRNAQLAVEAAEPAPQVLEVELRFGKRAEPHRGVVLPFPTPAHGHVIASRHSCSRLLPAPLTGSYRALVRPWSGTGRAGPALKLQGPIVAGEPARRRVHESTSRRTRTSAAGAPDPGRRAGRRLLLSAVAPKTAGHRRAALQEGGRARLLSSGAGCRGAWLALARHRALSALLRGGGGRLLLQRGRAAGAAQGACGGRGGLSSRLRAEVRARLYQPLGAAARGG